MLFPRPGIVRRCELAGLLLATSWPRVVAVLGSVAFVIRPSNILGYQVTMVEDGVALPHGLSVVRFAGVRTLRSWPGPS